MLYCKYKVKWIKPMKIYKKILLMIIVASSLFSADKIDVKSNNSAIVLCSEQQHSCNNSNACDKCGPCDCSNSCDLCGERSCDNVASYLESSRINLKCGMNWNVNASYLYWFASEESLVAAAHIKRQQGAVFITGTSVDYIDVPFKFHSGFKLGLGLNTCHDSWVLNFEYLSYRTKLSNSFPVRAEIEGGVFDDYVIPFWIPNGFLMDTIQTFTGTNNKWNLDTDILDFELSREAFWGKCLSIKPFIGVRTGAIDQKYKVTYQLSIIEPDGINNITVNTKVKSDSWLLGPRCGFGTKWYIKNCFSLIGEGAISLFYQRLRLKCNCSNEFSHGLPILITFNTDKIIRQVSASLESNLGFEIGSYFSNKKYHYSFALTYDWSIYLYQNWMRTLVNNSNSPVFAANQGLDSSEFAYNDSSPGNLIFHGLTLTAGLDF